VCVGRMATPTSIRLGRRVRRRWRDTLAYPLTSCSCETGMFRLGWAKQVVEAHGWGFEVWSEPPEPELANLRFLAGYRRARLFDAGLLDEIRGVDLDGVAFGEAVRSFPHRPEVLVRSAMLHLLWEQFFTTDLRTPLRASHRLWRAEAS
jgi:hypothetical protein